MKAYIRISQHSIPRILAIYTLVQITACASPPPPSSTTFTPQSAVVSEESQTVAAPSPPKMPTPPEDTAYRLGPDDVISVSVYSHPELSTTQQAGAGGLGGVLLTSDGTVSLPLIGDVNLDGQTIPEAQQKIASAYAGYINNPKITLQVVSAQSLRYYLLGTFSSPGVKYPGHSLSLLEAVSLGGSVNLENADLYQAYVLDGTRKLPIDLHALLIDGDLSQNVTLAPGDTIVIPPASTENAFVFGSVGRPGAVPFQAGSLSILQALSIAGLDLPTYTQAQLNQVRIIRSHGSNLDFIVVDARKIINGQAANFPLEPGDIVFVPPNGLATWNQAIGQLLPSLNTVGAVLNPAVAIAYLSRNNN